MFDWEITELSNGKKKYRKPILKVGTFVTTDDKEFEVKPEHLKHYKEVHYKKKEDGVKVPVPLEHKNKTNPEFNRGFLTDMEIEGDTLWGTFDFRGVEHPELMDVSVGIVKQQPDGKGNFYPLTIEHVALTNYPVVSGLGDWEAIAASLQTFDSVEDKTMDFGKLGQTLEIEGLTEENAEDKIVSAFEAIKLSLQEALKDKDESISLSQAKELAKTKPTIVKAIKKQRKGTISILLSQNYINKAVAEKLETLLCDDDVILLSLMDGDLDKVDDILEILNENEIVELSEVTGKQVLKDKNKQGDDQDEPYIVRNAKARAKAAKA